MNRWTLFVMTLITAWAAFFPGDLYAEASVNPQKIPEVLADKGKKLTAMKAVMNVTSLYDAEKSRQDVKGFLLYRRPADFRFQGLATGGNPLFELVIKDGLFELYIPSDGKILKGGKDCFGKRFPDVAEIEGLIPIILLQWKDVTFQKVLKQESENIVINVVCQGRTWEATLEPKNLLIKRLVRLGPHGEVDLTANFGEFKTGEDGWLPRRFEIQSPKGGWRTTVQISKIEPNPFLVEKNFKLEPTFSTTTESCK
jgi:outer membrane lipoprotein-sorting protein